MQNEDVSTFVEDECRKAGINIEHIKRLRQWLDTQPHLPSKLIKDKNNVAVLLKIEIEYPKLLNGERFRTAIKAGHSFLTRTLGKNNSEIILAYHSCNHSSEVTKQVIDLHFTLRTLFTNFFKDRRVDDARVLKALDVTLSVPLEMRSCDDFAISYHRLLDCDARKFVFADILRAVVMILDLWQRDTGTWPGYVIVIDLQGVTLSHLTKLDIIILQQFLYYLQEAMFVRLKQVHFLNAPSFMDKLLMMIKPFLKKELLDSLKTHQIGSQTIEQYLPLEALPKEAGGQYMTCKQAREEILSQLKANEEFFAMENKKRVVESLRPGKPKSMTDFFGGIEGSFKKLDID